MRRITVSRLPLDPGPPGWNRLLPAPAPARKLTGASRADWIVIGAGFAGLAAARRLRQLRPEDHITLLEAHRVGDGPAGRNSGIMIDLPHQFSSGAYGSGLPAAIAETEDNRRAIEFAAAMAAEFGLDEATFHRSGKILAAASGRGERHNRAHRRRLAAMGEPSRTLDAAGMRALTGTGYYRSGLYTPGAATIHSAAFVRGVAAGLTRAGVDLFEAAPVRELVREKEWTVSTPDGSVSAPRVILAVNGHLNSFGFLPGRLAHVFTYASMTRELTREEADRLGGQPHWALLPAHTMGTTVRRIAGEGGGRILVRNSFTFDPGLEADPGWQARVGRAHDRAFARRFPMLGEVDMAWRWGGRLCLSRNGVQVIRELAAGLYAACCQNGLGTVKGTLAGMLAAEMANGVDSPALRRALASPLPQRLPPAAAARLGATLRILGSEAAAGRER